MKTIPIVLASDENYVPYMYVTILSLLKNKNVDTEYDIYCLVTSSIKKQAKEKFLKLQEKYQTNIKFIDMGDFFSDNVVQINHITIPTYYRLKMPELLQNYEKAIYLDTDVIVLKDLTEYYNTDISNCYIAGVLAAGYKFNEESNKAYYDSIGLKSIRNYVNAGVTLWNLDKIRNDNKINELYDLANKNFNSMDQDVVNVAFQDGIKTLELKYNMMTTYYDITNPDGQKYSQYVEIYGENSIKEALKDPVIIHYADKIKPWDKSNSWLAKYWWKYAKDAPFPFWFRKNIFSMSQNSKHYILNILGLKIKFKNKKDNKVA